MKLYIKQKLFSFSQDFDIYDIEGTPVYRVKGNIIGFTRKQHLIDLATNEEVAFLRRKIFAILPKMEVFVRGTLVESIRMKLSFLKPRYELETLGWTVEGNILGHEYEVRDREGDLVGQVTKRFLAWSDTFEVDINQAEADPVMVLAIILAIDSVMDAN